MTAPMPSAAEINQICTQQASCDKEFAKALKVFYQSMNLARAQFLRVRQHKPPVSSLSAGDLFPLNLDILNLDICDNCLSFVWGFVYLSREQVKALQA